MCLLLMTVIFCDASPLLHTCVYVGDLSICSAEFFWIAASLHACIQNIWACIILNAGNQTELTVPYSIIFIVHSASSAISLFMINI